jgi:uncharacterized protein
MNLIRSLAVFLTLVFVGAAQTQAQTMPEPPSDSLSDLAAVLTSAETDRIIRLLETTRAETGVQMVVVTMPSIDAFGGAGMRLDAYAKALFNAWGVGAADRNDGILMLVATEAREVRIALGAGYDAVYDGRAARVLSTAVLPEFRADRLAAGIEAGIIASRERLIAPFQDGRPVSLTEGFAEEQSGLLPWLAGIGGIGGLIAYGLLRRARSRRTCPRCSEQTLTRIKEVIDPPTADSSGTGLLHLHCTSCGFIDRQSYSISPQRSGRRDGSGGSGGSSSGGSGFGGGRSTGGGASGKY